MPGSRYRGRARRHPCGWLAAVTAAAVLVLAPAGVRLAAAPPDYQRLYAAGIGFPEFLENARARRDEWRARYAAAAAPADLAARMRALPSRRLVLVVAEDWCADSASTVPYIARLVESAPDRLALRIIGAAAGAPVMAANPTPDGRAATPTVVVLAEDGTMSGAWVERPAPAQRWFLEQQKVMMQGPLHEQLAAWYEDDAGRTTMAEIAAILER